MNRLTWVAGIALVASVWCIAPPANGESTSTALIDFSDALADAPANYNLIRNPGVGATGNGNIDGETFDLVDFDTGVDTGWNLLIDGPDTGSWGDTASKANYTGTKPTAVSSFHPDATSDGLYHNIGSAAVSLVFSNLAPTAEYDILIYGGRGNNGPDADFAVTVGSGAGGSIETVLSNSTETVAFTATSDASGKLAIEWTSDHSASKNSSALNFLSISGASTLRSPGTLMIISGELPRQPIPHPNIVLIYTDDQGYGDMSTNNPSSKFQTPALDQLAAEGINFTDAHCSDTVCSPSRYGLLTGRYCWRTSLKTNVLGADAPALIPDDRTTLASLLRDHGYATAMIGKWHLGMDIPGTLGNRSFSQPIDDMPIDVGFSYFYGLPASLNFGYLAWIEGRYTVVNPDLWTKKKSNALMASDDSNSYRITPAYDSTRGANNLEVAADFDDVLCLTNFTTKAIDWMDARATDARNGFPFFIYVALTSPHKPVIPAEAFRGLSGAGAYGDFVMETDHHVDSILSFLDDSGLASNTMVIVTSDNGPENTYIQRVSTYAHDSAGIYRGGKRDVWEGGHRVPFVVRWPKGIKSPGRTWNKPVCQTDLMATLADMLGVSLGDNSGEDSASFYEVLTDDTATPTRLPMVNHGNDGRFAVREGDWKLVMPLSGSPYELYDLASDPTESTNVYAANLTLASSLESNITEIVTSGRTTPGSAVGNDTGWWDDLEWIDPADY